MVMPWEIMNLIYRSPAAADHGGRGVRSRNGILTREAKIVKLECLNV